MRSLKSISASMSGYTTDFYQGGRRSELVADKKIRVSAQGLFFSHSVEKSLGLSKCVESSSFALK